MRCSFRGTKLESKACRTDRQRDRQTSRQAGRQAEREKGRQTDGGTGRQIDRQIGRRQAGRQDCACIIGAHNDWGS